MTRRAFIALLFATPCAAADLPSPNWPRAAARGPVLLEQTVLRLHNRARTRAGVEPLRWSSALAASAMIHARHTATTGIYAHDRSPGRRKTMGENMWRGTRGVFSYDKMIGSMIEERRYFVPGPFPANSSTGRWNDVAHYTQIVWPSTTEVGCALASDQTTDYFVCRYSPPGNRDGIYLAPGPPIGGTLGERGR